jgi:hypothetical protein
MGKGKRYAGCIALTANGLSTGRIPNFGWNGQFGSGGEDCGRSAGAFDKDEEECRKGLF